MIAIDGLPFDENLEPHPYEVKSSARARTRRLTPQMRAALNPVATRELIIERMSDPAERAVMVASAELLIQTPTGVRVVPATPDGCDALPSSLEWMPARRIGTHHDAVNQIAFHPHVSHGRPRLLAAEALGELAWTRFMEISRIGPATSLHGWEAPQWMITQPFAVRVPIHDRSLFGVRTAYMWRIPDLFVGGDLTHEVFDVRPAERRDDYFNLTAAFSALVFAACGWTYRLLDDMPVQAKLNLRTICGFRWVHRSMRPARDAIVAHEPRTMGGMRDIDGGGKRGLVLGMHLLTWAAQSDLSKPLVLGTRLNWHDTDDVAGEAHPTFGLGGYINEAPTFTDGKDDTETVDVAHNDRSGKAVEERIQVLINDADKASVTDADSEGARGHLRGLTNDAPGSVTETGTLELRVGMAFSDGTTAYEIQGHHFFGRQPMFTVWAGGDDYRDMTMADLQALIVRADATLNPTPYREAIVREDRLGWVDPTEMDRVIELARHLREVRTGFKDPQPMRTRRPDPRYDPTATSLTQRVALKAAELGIGQSTVWGKLKLLGDPEDISRLVHGNTRDKTDALRNVDPAIVEFSRVWLAAQSRHSTRLVQNIEDALCDALSEAGLGPVSEHHLDLLVRYAIRGASLTGDAGTREKKELRGPRREFVRSVPGGFCDVVEGDATQADFFAYSPATGEALPVYVIQLHCRRTKIRTFRLSTSPPSGRDFGLALARAMMPPTVVDTGSSWPFGTVKPGIVRLLRNPDPNVDGWDPEMWPAMMPNEIVLDHGREHENLKVFSLLASMGITPILAQTKRPTRKPNVEGGFKGFSQQFSQLLHENGFKSHSVKGRASKIDTSGLLTVEELQMLADEYAQTLLDVPHTGLPHPLVPNLLQTPREAWSATINSGVPIRFGSTHAHIAMRLLDTVTGVVNDEGVHVGGYRYECDDLDVMTALSAGDLRTPGQPLRFAQDPVDRSRIFWRYPRTGHYYTLTAVNARGLDMAPFNDVLTEDVRTMKPSKRFSNKERREHFAELRAHIRRRSQSKAGQKVWARAFAQWREAVLDPDTSPFLEAQSDDVERPRPTPTSEAAAPAAPVGDGVADPLEDADGSMGPGDLSLEVLNFDSSHLDEVTTTESGSDDDDYEALDLDEDDLWGFSL